MLETTQAETRERARRAAQRRADDAKAEFGRLAFDALEEYFPEEAAARRGEDRMALLGVGIAVGFFLGLVVGR